MALQIRRGNTSERVAATPADGEISWDKTLKQLFVGELGSPNVWTNALSTAAGTGLQWNSGTSKLDVTGASFNSDVITEGSTNRFFTNERAQDAVSTMFTSIQYILTTTPTISGTGPYLVTYYFSATAAPSTSYQYAVAGAANTAFNGTKTATASSTTSITLSYASNPGAWVSGGTVTITSVIHNGITFIYDDTNDKLLATVTGSATVQSDTSPRLGGNLTLNSYSITGTGAISITGAITGTTISAGTGLGASLSLNGNNITGTGNINTVGTFYASTGLGGNLVLNNNNITGTGNINTTGTFYASSGLGGNLVLNGSNITGTGNISITGNLSVTGLGANLSLNSRDITGTGNINTVGTFYASTGLGGSLVLNGNNITGTGNINTTGDLAVTGTIGAYGLGRNFLLNSYDITGTGNISVTGNISATGLGANLSLNSKSITGPGDIDISGRINTLEIVTTLTSVASGVCTLASVTGLTVGMPIVFNYVSQNSGVLGNIIPSIAFYILTINTNLSQITISRSRSGAQFATGTASNTTMKVTANGIDTGILTTNVMNVNSMLVFRDMTYPVALNTYQIAGIGSYFVFGNATTPNNFVFNSETSDQGFSIRGVTNGFLGNQTQLNLGSGRGTLSVPQLVQNGDSIGLIRFDAYTGSSQMAGYGNGAFISAFVSDSNITSGDIIIDATLMMGNINDVAGGRYTTFAPGGIVTIPVTTRKLSADNNNWITVATTSTYSLSTTVSKNMLLVGSSGLTATLTFPSANLIDGQEISFTVITNTVTLALTAGPTLEGTFAGSVTAGTTIKYVYRTSNTTWYKIQ